MQDLIEIKNNGNLKGNPIRGQHRIGQRLFQFSAWKILQFPMLDMRRGEAFSLQKRERPGWGYIKPGHDFARDLPVLFRNEPEEIQVLHQFAEDFLDREFDIM